MPGVGGNTSNVDPDKFWHEGAWYRKIELRLPGPSQYTKGSVEITVSEKTPDSATIKFKPTGDTFAYLWSIFKETDDYGEAQLSNPLAGLMRCSQCGTVIQYKETIRPTKQYYWFRHRPDTTQRCNCQSADYQEVMDAVARSLQNFINDFTTQLKNADGEAVKQHAAMLDEMEKNLSAMQARRKDLFEYFEKKIYTEEEFLERKGELNTQIETLSARIAETRATQPAEIDYREKIVKFSAALDALRDPDATPKKINDLLKEIVSKIS